MFPQYELVQQFVCDERKRKVYILYFHDILLINRTVTKSEINFKLYTAFWLRTCKKSKWTFMFTFGMPTSCTLLETIWVSWPIRKLEISNLVIFNLRHRAFSSYRWMGLQWIGSCTSDFSMTLHTQHLWWC